MLDDLKSVVFDEDAVTGKFVLLRVANKSTGDTKYFLRGSDAATHKHIQIRDQFLEEVDRSKFAVTTAGGAFYRFNHKERMLTLFSSSYDLGAIRDHELLRDILKLEESYMGFTLNMETLNK